VAAGFVASGEVAVLPVTPGGASVSDAEPPEQADPPATSAATTNKRNANITSTSWVPASTRRPDRVQRSRSRHKCAGASTATVRDVTDALDHPYQDLIGFEIESGDGVSRAWVEIDDQHLNPHGAVHGAAPYALVDTAMGGATMSVLPEGNWCSTVDIHIRYLSACFGGRLTATATVRRAGKRIVHLDATVTDDGGTEYAIASGVFAVTPARD
jgi:acyl-CoA thioesterase